MVACIAVEADLALLFPLVFPCYFLFRLDFYFALIACLPSYLHLLNLSGIERDLVAVASCVVENLVVHPS